MRKVGNDTAAPPSGETPLIRNLQDASSYEHRVTEIKVIETHISWVLLTGAFAYKIKKPVQFPFADFSTLGRRQFYCHEELRLNRRLAPPLYLDVVPIAGTVEQPVMNGSGKPIEYAVKMRQFSQESLLSRMLKRNALLPSDFDGLAQEVAAFHEGVAVAVRESRFGSPESIAAEMRGNFQELNDLVDDEQRERLATVREWSEAEFERLRSEFAARQSDGFVRECHGDMHLGNMILDQRDGRRHVVIFDGIDFNEDLRWIDVMSDVAFCVMDLADRGREDFGRRFLNAYLEKTGDYAGLQVLPFYLVYRALVRAKVAHIRLHQYGITNSEAVPKRRELAGYLALADSYTQRPPPRLFITHGPSGSGKTFGTQSLVDSLGAVRIRSDVERKRLRRRPTTSDTPSNVAQDLYSPETTERTYARLAELAMFVLRAGFSVVVDATFLQRRQRDAFHTLADSLGVPFCILDFHAARSTLERRIRHRQDQQHDASEATVDVLAHQLEQFQPLETDEAPFAVVVDTDVPECVNELPARLGLR